MRALALLALCLCACHDDDVVEPADLSALVDLSVTTTPDAAEQPDLGPVALALALPCDDAVDDVYVTPPLGPTSLGDVVRCARDTSVDLDPAAVKKALDGEGITLAGALSGVTGYRVSYRTTRGTGASGASTARVYLPTTPRALPLPVVVVGHPTEGVGDACAPSKSASELLDVALPWAALGYVVIAPDYTGLGNEGLPGYLDNREQGWAILDGARALRKLFLDGDFEQRIVLEGWSQGGGAVLSAQALAASYGANGTIAAAVAFAPEWPIRDDSFGLATMAENPDAFVAFDPANSMISYSNHVIWAQRAYGYFGGFSALTTDPGAAFPAATRAGFVSAMNSLCGEVQIGGAIYLAAHPPYGAKNGDLFDETFREAFVACLGDLNATACSGLGKELTQHLRGDVLTADKNGAPILYLQGLADTVLPPATEAACVVAKLTADGVTPTVCVDTLAQHTDVTNRNMAYAIGWVQAKLAGTQPAACPSTATLPAGSCN